MYSRGGPDNNGDKEWATFNLYDYQGCEAEYLIDQPCRAVGCTKVGATLNKLGGAGWIEVIKHTNLEGGIHNNTLIENNAKGAFDVRS